MTDTSRTRLIALLRQLSVRTGSSPIFPHGEPWRKSASSGTKVRLPSSA